jgi:outer membrane protein TolC
MRLGTDVAAALMNLKGAYEAALLHKRMWETSAEELRLAEERFRLGLAGSLELVDSQTRLGAAEKSQLDSIYQFHKLLVSLEALVGEPLR